MRISIANYSLVQTYPTLSELILRLFPKNPRLFYARAASMAAARSVTNASKAPASKTANGQAQALRGRVTEPVPPQLRDADSAPCETCGSSRPSAVEKAVALSDLARSSCRK